MEVLAEDSCKMQNPARIRPQQRKFLQNFHAKIWGNENFVSLENFERDFT